MRHGEDERAQDEFSRTLENALHQLELITDDEIVAGWVVCFETVRSEGPMSSGHVYGPPGMTSWRALGLMEWARDTIKHSPEES
jgi:hypothetical protein